MKTELLCITPDVAKNMLGHNPINRNLSERAVADFSKVILDGDWQITHQGIAFYEDGTLADGQHRLSAVIRANHPVYMMVTTGLAKDSAMSIDSGRRRSLIDGIKISGQAPWMEAKHIGLVPIITYPRRLTDMQKVDFLMLMKPHVEFAAQCFISNRRHLTSSIVHASIAMAHYHGVDEVKLIRFAEVFLNGIMGSANEKVIIICREYFLNNTNGGEVDKHEKFLKMQRAIQAYANDENVKRLVTPQDVIYSANGLF
jgi:hypothetical protein